MENVKKIIERIKKEQIEPTPKWIFTSRNLLIWFAFAFALIFGALAFSVVLLAIQQTDFNIISHLSHSWLEFLLGLLPFIWLIFVLISLLLAMITLRHSERGYKISFYKLATLSLLISMALGTLFFLTGGSDRLEKAFDLNVLNYESIEERKMQIWNNPDEGYLAGTILQANSEIIDLRDFNGRQWQIPYEGAFIAPIIMLEPGEYIKIIGKKSRENEFQAEEIRPWGGRGSFRNNGKGRNQNR